MSAFVALSTAGPLDDCAIDMTAQPVSGARATSLCFEQNERVQMAGVLPDLESLI